MTESKHTKLPWKELVTEDGFHFVGGEDMRLGCSFDDVRNAIAEVYGEGNAAYIVQCCNAYPSLVESLKEAHALCIGWAAFYQHDHNLPAFHPVHQAIIDKVTTALRSAGEEL